MHDDFLKPPAQPQPHSDASPASPPPQLYFHKKSSGSFWSLRRILVLLVFLAGSACGGAGLGVLITYLGEIPLVSDLKAYKPSLSTKIYDCKGNLITELFAEQRTLVTLEQVPPRLQQAVLAIEDNNFYHHGGIELSGIARSVIINFLKKSRRQGGSTITQQLARNMFLTRNKTIERKIKEIILAFQIEYTYSKREILEMYLNQIYLGNGAYGMHSAAQTYFGKRVQDLTLPECAMLAALPRAPNAYNPYRKDNEKKALERRNLVLSQMQRFGYISMQEMVDAKMTPIKLSSRDASEAPFFVEYVRRQLEERYGSNAIYQSGLRVYTTLDLEYQRMAQKAMDEGMAEAEPLIKPRMQNTPGQEQETIQNALVLLEPATGEIKAFIGGRDFEESKFIRVVQAQRQPGSSFKPFIYTTAMLNGFTPADVILDTPVVYTDEKGQKWKPENYENEFRGPMTLRTALTLSCNVVTVKLLDKIGPKNVIEVAKKFGIKSELQPYLSLGLGTSEVNLLEMVSAFGCFPNHGVRVEPVSIKRVESASGEVLEENTPYHQDVIDPAVAAVMTNLLESVVNHGTGNPVRRLGFNYPAAGKTGTTNDFSDAWFIGFTSEYVAGVWIGLDSHKSMGKGITGGLVASPIWAKLMLQIYKDRAPKNFTYPESVEFVDFCNVSGLLPNPGCQKYITRSAFAIGTAPTQHCDVHVGAGLAASPDDYQLNVSPDLADIKPGPKAPVSKEKANPAPPAANPTPVPAPEDPERPPVF